MEPQETIDLYEAIREMRKFSQQGKSFSFVHATYNRYTGTCEGIRAVQNAHLRPASKGDDLANADYKIFYFDEDLQQPRICWQPLILFFGNKKVILN